MGLRLLLEVVRAILAATTGMENTALGWLTQVYGHLQHPDCQVLLHPVVNHPTDDAPAEQINGDSRIEPAFCGPNVADVTSPLQVTRGGQEIPVQKVGSNAKLALATGGDLVATGAHGPDPVVLHQSANALFPDVKPRFPEFQDHARPSVGGVAQGIMFMDMRQ